MAVWEVWLIDAQGWLVDGGAVDERLVDGRPVDGRPVDGRLVDGRLVEAVHDDSFSSNTHLPLWSN